jgi:hypothetical protein
MKGKKALKWVASVVLLTLAMAAFIPATGAAPGAQEPSSVVCGDSITCSTAGNAVYVKNTGTGAAIYGQNTSTGDGLKGRGNPGVYGFSFHAAGIRGKSNQGIGVKGESVDKYGIAGYSDSSAGVFARGGFDGVDLVLGGSDSSAAGDNGRIRTDPAYSSSDLYLTSNDAVLVELDADDDEDGAFRVQSSGTLFFQVEDSGRVHIPTDATWATTIDVGDRYRDNAVIAWANVNSDGTVGWEFGVTSVTRAGAGNYIIEIDAATVGTSSYIPMAIAEVEAQPDSAAAARILSINQTSNSIFRVYITDGNWAMVDNQFMFMVTGR